jgi:hypothetical protein
MNRFIRNPSPRFLAVVNALQELEAEEKNAGTAFACAVATTMQERHTRGLKPATGRKCICRLWRRRCAGVSSCAATEGMGVDHATLYSKDGQPARRTNASAPRLATT